MGREGSSADWERVSSHFKRLGFNWRERESSSSELLGRESRSRHAPSFYGCASGERDIAVGVAEYVYAGQARSQLPRQPSCAVGLARYASRAFWIRSGSLRGVDRKDSHTLSSRSSACSGVSFGKSWSDIWVPVQQVLSASRSDRPEWLIVAVAVASPRTQRVVASRIRGCCP